MHEIKCPVCDLVLESYKVYDGYYDDEKHEEEWYGYCPKCGKEYHWTIVFVYKDVVDFGEVREGE